MSGSHTTDVSPLAPARFPDMPPVRGMRLAAGAAGLRYRDRDDLLFVVLDSGSAVAGVFTRSQTAAAPVLWCRQILKGGHARALVVNAGNANAFTGAAGEQAVEQTAVAAAGILGCSANEVFVASTGVIGEPPAADKIVRALPRLHNGLGDGGWSIAAKAIATTDTFAKGSTRTVEIDGRPVTINGIAKGAGMIAPDMATMLAFVFTDAAIAPSALQALLADGVGRSFNCITVDGDTSTNDTLLAFATNAAGHELVTEAEDARLGAFRPAFEAVLIELATQIVRDGEGASKFVTITVAGAESDGAARVIALAVANSPLVKTAVAGADANWGRIVMAVGKAGERIDRDRLSITIGDIVVAEGGGPVPGYDEAPVARHMKGLEVEIGIDVGVGRGRATVWTCDLTHGYIDINASYRS
jgi:glutamate N-acetyltransferase/amino-acid N-acetyltransferase